jgi:hypothetical protein
MVKQTWTLRDPPSDLDPLKHARAEVLDTLLSHFKVTGEIHVRSDLSVDVVGSVVNVRKRPLPDGVIPVKFHHIKAGFFVDNCGLVSWHNSPRIVQGHLWASGNPLTDLKGAPEQVHGYLGIAATEIRSLEHVPTHVTTLALDYQDQMPLLRALTCNHVEFPNVRTPAPEAVKSILNKYAGKGKSHMLLCANELKKAGFEGNAAW